MLSKSCLLFFFLLLLHLFNNRALHKQRRYFDLFICCLYAIWTQPQRRNTTIFPIQRFTFPHSHTMSGEGLESQKNSQKNFYSSQNFFLAIKNDSALVFSKKEISKLVGIHVELEIGNKLEPNWLRGPENMCSIKPLKTYYLIPKMRKSASNVLVTKPVQEAWGHF